jgi:hypothetical protein
MHQISTQSLFFEHTWSIAPRPFINLQNKISPERQAKYCPPMSRQRGNSQRPPRCSVEAENIGIAFPAVVVSMQKINVPVNEK